jgi:membrane protease subunit HflC
MMTQARDLIRPDMAELGVDVVDVRILRTDLTDQVSAQTYDRMKAERLAQAALLRANGQQAAQSIRAIANRQSIEIVADATKDSEILRGQGDATRSQVYADAYNIDPNFFAFYRSMQAYRTGLSSSGTTMLLSPDSEFFQYFGSEGKSAVPTGVNLPPPAQPTVAPVPDVIPPKDSNTLDNSVVTPVTPVINPDVAPTPAANDNPAPATPASPAEPAPAAAK